MIPTSVTTADFNGDGKPDLAFGFYGAPQHDRNRSDDAELRDANRSRGRRLLASVAAFATPVYIATRYYWFRVAIGNLDADPRADVAVVGDGDGVQILDNRTPSGGALNLLASVEFPATEPYASAIADFNGDGKPDLGVTEGTGVEILLAR